MIPHKIFLVSVLAVTHLALASVLAEDEAGGAEESVTVEDAEEAADAAAERMEAEAEAAEDRAEAAAKEAEDADDEECPERPCKCRDRCGVKAAGVFAPQILWLDSDLLRKVQGFEEDLDERDFGFNGDYTFTFGSLGYFNVGNGVRIGGGGWGGYKKYESDEYRRTLVDDSTGDTTRYDAVTVLRVIPAFGGALVEKAFEFNRWSIFAGGMLGGGVLVIHKQVREVGDIFADAPDDSLDWIRENNAVAVAPAVSGDIHAGVSVVLAPVFQVGVEGVLVMMYAPDGFVTGTGFGDFVTVTPAVRLRFAFGK